MLNLLQPIAGLAGQWMSNRAEKAKAKQALAVAKIEEKRRPSVCSLTPIGKKKLCRLRQTVGRTRLGR